MKINHLLVLVVIGSVFLCEVAKADQTFKASGKNKVHFVSKITAGSFDVNTSEVKGSLVLDDSKKIIKATEVAVPVKSLDSGMSVRNDHMQNKYLESGKFPEIVFSFKDAKIDLQSGASQTFPGEFTIHGVKKSITVDAKITQASDKKIEVKAQFPLNILDYGIEQPKFAVVKMDPTIQVDVELSFEQ